MAFKSLCSLWSLLLVLQHALSFSLEQHCARRCLFGRGGILCNCNAIHFTGKRSSLNPHISDLKSQTLHDNRPNRLLSILNRPDFSPHARESGLSEPPNRDAVMLHRSPFDADELRSQGLDEGGNTVDVGDALLSGISQNRKRFDKDKSLGEHQSEQIMKSPLYRYGGLTRELAQVVKSVWQHMATPKDIDNQPASQSNAQINLMAEGYDSGNADATTRDESQRNEDILDNNQVRIIDKPSLAEALEALIKKLPSLVHRHNGRFDSDNDNLVNGVDESQRLVQPNNGLGDVRERNLNAWNHLMRYLAHNMAVRERTTLLHRSRRDQSKDLSNTGMKKSD